METVNGVRWFQFTTYMRWACACGQVTECLAFLLLELRFPKLDPASFERYSKKTTLLQYKYLGEYRLTYFKSANFTGIR